MMKDVYMGRNVRLWMSNKKIQYVTFNVTDNCNLACKYCYFTHKTDKKRMSFNIAKKAVDNILSDDRLNEFDGVVWDFIGGEPTLELELIDEICEYIVENLYIRKHKWFDCYKFMIGTNGLLYNSQLMQKMINKYGSNLQVSITIDGNKEKHDLSRVKKDGTGSYDDVVSNIPLWLKQQNSISTKATFSHDDLPYLKDSIIHLWNLGIKNVSANVVFENVWKENDIYIYQQQLHALADYIIENNYWYDYSVRFFDPSMGMPIPESSKRINYCGTGKMIAISTDGKYYPCVRFMDSALNKQKGRSIGDINSGFNFDKIRAFELLDYNTQNDSECMNCEVASGCAWCSGLNYDESEIGTIFDRKKYNCEMHKVNVQECRYLWKMYEKNKKEISPYRIKYLSNNAEQCKNMYIIEDSNFESFCYYNNNNNDNSKLDETDIIKALEYCDNNNYKPVIMTNRNYEFLRYTLNITDDIRTECNAFSTCLVVNDYDAASLNNYRIKNIILKTKKENIKMLGTNVSNILRNNLNICNISIVLDNSKIDDSLLNEYKNQLSFVSDLIIEHLKKGRVIDISTITHELRYSSHHNCKAGVSDVTLGPDGRYYICPAFYFDVSLRDKYCLGDLKKGFSQKFKKYCDIKMCKACKDCSIYSCNKCIYQSVKMTEELGIPGYLLCKKSEVEKQISKQFIEKAGEYEKQYRQNNIL